MLPYNRIIGLFAVACLLFSVQSLYAAPLTQSSMSLRYGEIVRGQLSEEESEDIWTFAGHAQDRVLLDLRAINMNALDTYLTLMDADGNTLLTDDDSGERLNSRIGLFELPESGDYQVKVSRFGGGGEYILQVINLNTAPVIKPGKSLVGSVNSVNPGNYFLLTSLPTDTLWNLRISNDDPNVEPFIALYDANGLIVTTERLESAEIDPFLALPDQAYAVVVSWNESSSGGLYELLLNPSAVTLLKAGTPQTGNLDYEENVNPKHYFRGMAGQTVHITVTTTSGDIAPSIEILSSDGNNRLFFNEGEAVREVTAQLTLPVDTVYVITVTDGTFQEENGTYTVSLKEIAGPEDN